MIDKIKISAVSYLNSLPFVYGLNHSAFLQEQCKIELDIPSVCAEKLLSNQVDIGLVPVAILSNLSDYYIISDYCIGSVGKVNSVMLFSQKPIDQIERIILDYQSRTSVNLVKILANNFWRISPSWISGSEGFEKQIQGSVAGVVIGDRALNLFNDFPYKYDLSEEWHKFTGLPFVFACWVSNKKMATAFLTEFNQAMKIGMDNIDVVINEYSSLNKNSQIDLKTYLTVNISYHLDEEKKKGMRLFLDYLTEMKGNKV